jgi:hypothetical protein
VAKRFVFRICVFEVWACAFRRDGLGGELKMDVGMVENGPSLVRFVA